MWFLAERCEISCNRRFNLYVVAVKIHICTLDIVRLTDYTEYSTIWRSGMFEYMTVQEAAKLWGVSERQIQKLCKANRIEGVVHLSRVWLIPKNANRPIDARRKKFLK